MKQVLLLIMVSMLNLSGVSDAAPVHDEEEEAYLRELNHLARSVSCRDVLTRTEQGVHNVILTSIWLSALDRGMHMDEGDNQEIVDTLIMRCGEYPDSSFYSLAVIELI